MENLELLPECPFYDQEVRRRIKCESPFEGSILQVSFGADKGFKEHREAYCCSMNWEKCPIAKMLNDKYEAERWGK